MNAYVLLAGAIATEVMSTLSLKPAEGFTRLLPSVVVVIGYATSFVLLGIALKQGLNVGVAYAIWSGVGTSVVALAGYLFYKESLSALGVIGIGLIIIGVVLLQLGHGTSTSG